LNRNPASVSRHVLRQAITVVSGDRTVVDGHCATILGADTAPLGFAGAAVPPPERQVVGDRAVVDRDCAASMPDVWSTVADSAAQPVIAPSDCVPRDEGAAAKEPPAVVDAAPKAGIGGNIGRIRGILRNGAVDDRGLPIVGDAPALPNIRK